MFEKLVNPHKKISREVVESDLERLSIAECKAKMLPIFLNARNCVALAHPQVDDQDPLRFYVLSDGKVFINPIIERHSAYTVKSVEGCMTFIGREHITRDRWRKVTISFQTIEEGKLSERKTENLVGVDAFIAQHEIDHLDGIYCYDNTTKE